MSWLYGAAGSIIAFFGTLTICLDLTCKGIFMTKGRFN